MEMDKYEAEARKLFDAELRKFNMDEHAYYVGCQGELDDADMAAISAIAAALVERDQQRADKLEMAADAKRWAEEAGRLKALLHDAQRDAERYRWLRDKAQSLSAMAPIVIMASEHFHSYSDDFGGFACGEALDALTDAAMAAEREVSNGRR